MLKDRTGVAQRYINLVCECHCNTDKCSVMTMLRSVGLDSCASDLNQSWKTSRLDCSCCLEQSSSGNASTNCYHGFLVCQMPNKNWLPLLADFYQQIKLADKTW